MLVLFLLSFASSQEPQQQLFGFNNVFEEIRSSASDAGDISPERILSFKMYLKDLEIYLTLRKMALSRPSKSVDLSELTPAFLFERPTRLPAEFLKQLTSKLSYLRECGVTPSMVHKYFVENWSRIKKFPVLLDVGCDVSLCHVQAAVNHLLLRQYSKENLENIPPYVMAYFSFCLLLSDHSEIREGKGSFSYLHHPEHAKGLKNPETFPLSGIVGATSKKMVVTAFFPRLRMVVASQALLFASEGGIFPSIVPHEISGVPVPKTAYPETFRLFFMLMEKHRMLFFVELVHVLPPLKAEGEPELCRELSQGVYSNSDSPVGEYGENDNVLVIQMFTVGLSKENREGMVKQLGEFDIIKAVITETVRQTQTEEVLEETTALPEGVSGWLKEVFAAGTARNASLFDDKFCAQYVKKAIANGRVGVAPRHLYCTTVCELRAEYRQ